jgi:hypothetical protein
MDVYGHTWVHGDNVSWQYLDFDGSCEAWVALGGCALTADARQRPGQQGADSSDDDAEPEDLTRAIAAAAAAGAAAARADTSVPDSEGSSDDEDGDGEDSDSDREGNVQRQYAPLPDDNDEAGTCML